MKKISILFFSLFVMTCAQAYASTVDVKWNNVYDYSTTGHGKEYVTQFNVTLDGDTTTYGYCVAPTITIDKGNYSYSFLDWNADYLQAAWLMDAYSPASTTTEKFDVVSVQSAIWTAVTNDVGYAPTDTSYDYDEYLSALPATLDASTISYLMQNYKVMYTYIGETAYQTLIIKYASTPAPAAVWLLGSGIIGLLGYRRYQA